MATIPRPCKLLKEMREGIKMSQEKLADEAGVSRRAVQEIEAGTLPNIATLEALAGALDREAWEFLIPEKRSMSLPIDKGSTLRDAWKLLEAFEKAEYGTRHSVLALLGIVEIVAPASLKPSSKPRSGK